MRAARDVLLLGLALVAIATLWLGILIALLS
jgi:hypothetical protein